MSSPIELIINGRDNSRGAFSSASSGLAHIGQIAAGILASRVFIFLADQVKDFAVSVYEEGREAQLSQQGLLQTLMSTGNTAHTTVQKIQDLSMAISENSKYTDEQVQAGAGMLLTFKKIGEDVFPQATQAAVDLAEKFGGDITENAMRLGKALDDPVRGVTALRRVGVTFSKDQETMIKQLVKTGDVAGAQAIIMKEVTRQSGGFAASQATSYDKLNHKIHDMKEAIGLALLPTLDKFGDKMMKVLDSPAVQAALTNLIDWLGKKAPEALTAFSNGLDHVLKLLSKGDFSGLARMISSGLHKINWEGLSKSFEAGIKKINWAKLGQEIAKGSAILLRGLISVFLRIDWPGIFGAISVAILAMLGGVFNELVQAWAPAIKQIGTTIELLRNIIDTKLAQIKSAIAVRITQWVVAIMAKIGEFHNIGTNLVNAMKSGILAAWSGLVATLLGLVAKLPTAVKTLLHISSPSKVFHNIGKNITEGLSQGVNANMQSPLNSMKAVSQRMQKSGDTRTYNRSTLYNFGVIIRGERSRFRSATELSFG